MAPTARPTDRLGAVDVTRFLAVCAVAYFHCALPGFPYALAGLHALVLLTIFYSARVPASRSLSAVVGQRAQRILLPFAVWSAIYAPLAVRQHLLDWTFPFAGTWVHLWFLPFVYVVGLAAVLVSRAGLLPVRPAAVIAGAVLAGVWAAAESLLYDRWPLRTPFAQYISVAPSVLFGVIAVPIARHARPVRLALAAVAAAAIASVGTTLALQRFAVGPLPLVNPAWFVGDLIGLAALLVPLRGNAITGWMGRASYGVYLVHELAKQASIRGHLQMGTPAILVSTLLLALAVTALIERTPLRRING